MEIKIKKIKKELIMFDDYRYGCKFCNLAEKCVINNFEDCSSMDCKLAHEADLTEIKELDKHLYKEHRENFSKEDLENEENCCPASEYGSNWMIKNYEH